MKRITVIVLCLAGLLVFVFAGVSVEQPEPKPVLLESKTWMMYGKVIAYEQRVLMPDGSKQWLTVRPEAGKLAPRKVQWQAKADTLWAAHKAAVEAQPKICPYCGGTGVLP